MADRIIRTANMNGRQAAMVALGGTIGAGLFLGVGEGLRVAGPGMVLLFAAAAVLAWGVTKALGESVIASGQGTTFIDATSRILGSDVARLQAWGYWTAAVLACATQIGASAAILHDWLGCAPLISVTVALAFLTVLNRAPAGVVGEVESWLSLLKVAVLACLVLAGLIAASLLLWSPAPRTTLLLTLPMGSAGVFKALPLALFAFGNVELVGIASADLDDPGSTLAPTIRHLMVRLALLNIGSAAALLFLQALNAEAATTENSFLAVLNRSGIAGSAQIMRVVLLSVFTSSCNACLYGAASALRALPTSRSSIVAETAGRLRGKTVLWTATAVAAVLLVGSSMPVGASANILAGAALFGLVNWGIILLAHIRARRTAGRASLISIVTLAGVTIALLCIASQRDFRLASVLTATCIVAVLLAGRRVADR